MSTPLRRVWRVVAIGVALLTLLLAGACWTTSQAQETPTPTPAAAPVLPEVQEITGFLQVDVARACPSDEVIFDHRTEVRGDTFILIKYPILQIDRCSQKRIV